MDDYNRIERNMLHNLAQPARQIDAVWPSIAAKLSNGDAASVSCVSRFFNAVMRERMISNDICADDLHLLDEIRPIRSASTIQHALCQFYGFLTPCSVCGCPQRNARFQRVWAPCVL